MIKTVDLHVHSYCSDGTLSPTQLVELALAKGLSAFALTDHDTTAGLEEAFHAAQNTGLEVIAGIEFSTKYQDSDVHIVGLDMDYQNPEFIDQLRFFQHSRDIRNEKMIQNLHDAGIDISVEQMLDSFGDAIWTRAHFARYLRDHGVVKEMSEAFQYYIGEDCPYYVPREFVTPAQAVELIYRTGGIPILAHPMLYRFSEETLHDLLSSLKEAGLIGIEAIYSTHTCQQERLVRKLAKHHNLILSGGSDFHGSNKPDIDLGCGRGNLVIPYEILQNLRNRRKDHE
ncbi:MAG: PHP domain-containing protein [Eubacteriales bacterium]|nr:PHP domain-containing protein [Eubacteriales bacterium]